MRAWFAIILFIFGQNIWGMSQIRAFWGSRHESHSKNPALALLYTKSTAARDEENEDLEQVGMFALEQYEKATGNAAELHIVGVDDGDDPEIAQKNLSKVLNKNAVKVIIGPVYSRVAMGLKAFIEEKRIPLISIFATHNDLTKSSEYILRICASNKVILTGLVNHLVPAIKENGLSVFSFKDLTDSYSVNLSETFKSMLESRKVPVQEVAFRGVKGLENLRDLNSRIWNPSKKDLLFLPNRDLLAGKILASLESEPFLVAAVDTVNFLPLMNRIKPHESHIKILTASQWLPQKTGFSASIEDAFQKRFKRPMTITSALTFDAVWVAAKGYRRSLTSAKPLNEVLRDGTALIGVTGAIVLGRDGEREAVEKFIKEELIR